MWQEENRATSALARTRTRAMHILVVSALTGDEIASVRVEQEPVTVRDVQRLVKRSTGVPKKAQHMFDGARAWPQGTS